MNPLLLCRVFSVAIVLALSGCVSASDVSPESNTFNRGQGGGPFDDEGDPEVSLVSAPDKLLTNLDFSGSPTCARQVAARVAERVVGGCDVTSVGGLVYLPFASLIQIEEKSEKAKEEIKGANAPIASLKLSAYGALAKGNGEEALGYLSGFGKRGKPVPDSEVFTLRGNAFVLLEKSALGVASYESALKLDARNELANLNLGLLLQRQGENLNALLYFKRSIAGRNSYLPAFVHGANSAYLMGNMEVALALLEKAEGLFGAEPLVVYNLGVVYQFGFGKEYAAKRLYLNVMDSSVAPKGLKSSANSLYAAVVQEPRRL